MNIWIAASDGNIPLVKQYLTSLSPNIQDDNGYAPIHAAASYNHVELCRLLIEEYKADLKLTDSDGDSALHLVGGLECCKLLVENGAQVDLRNQQGRLPIEVAFVEGLEDVVDYLKQYTSEFVEYEAEEGNEEALNYLISELVAEGEIQFN